MQFLFQLPTSLTLRIWDIYLLEGEKALVAMAYNILKMHKRKYVCATYIVSSLYK